MFWQSAVRLIKSILFICAIHKDFPLFMPLVMLENRRLNKIELWSWLIMLLSCWPVSGLSVLSSIFFKKSTWVMSTLSHYKPEKCPFCCPAYVKDNFNQFKSLRLKQFSPQFSRCYSTVFLSQHHPTKHCDNRNVLFCIAQTWQPLATCSFLLST